MYDLKEGETKTDQECVWWTTSMRKLGHITVTGVGLTLIGALDLTNDGGQLRSLGRTHRRQMPGVRN